MGSGLLHFCNIISMFDYYRRGPGYYGGISMLLLTRIGATTPLCLYWCESSLSGDGLSFRNLDASLRYKVDLRPGERSLKVSIPPFLPRLLLGDGGLSNVISGFRSRALGGFIGLIILRRWSVSKNGLWRDLPRFRFLGGCSMLRSSRDWFLGVLEFSYPWCSSIDFLLDLRETLFGSAILTGR